MAAAKSVKIVLESGDPDGVFTLKCSHWDTGVLYSCSRERIDELLRFKLPEYGIYLLLSDKQVYVGQTQDLILRTKQHLQDELVWWTREIILTSREDAFSRSDLDYLEAVLIQKVGNSQYKCENKKRGNPQKVEYEREIELDRYLEEAHILLDLLGLHIFSQLKETTQTEISSFDTKKNENAERKKPESTACIGCSNGKVSNRKEAKMYLKNQGIILDKYAYATLNKIKGVYWFNPNISVLENDYSLVLNNKEKHELVLINIPAKSLAYKGQGDNVLKVRHDRPKILDLNISENLVDQGSRVDFNRFTVRKFFY